MKRSINAFAALAGAAAFGGTALADMDDFQRGAVMPGFGKVAPVEADLTVPAGTTLKMAFDVMTSAETDAPNRAISKVARFINMHGEGGLEPAPLDLAMVVHGKATKDLLDADDNLDAALIEALLEQNVRVVVCGQSLAALGIDPAALIEGVEVATSAMTAHAVLQAEGYGVMPF